VEHYVEMLLGDSTRHALALFRAWSRCHQAVLVIRRGDLVMGLQLLRAGLDELGEAKSALRFLAFLSEMAEALGRAGQIADGLATIEEAMERSERTEERWVTAELLRIKGELLLLEGRPEPLRRPTTTSGRGSTGRTGKARSPGNCAAPRALPGCALSRQRRRS
jgi:predicted ATPase